MLISGRDETKLFSKKFQSYFFQFFLFFFCETLLSTVLRDFILEHYSEDGDQHAAEISEFNSLRDGTMTPARDEEGIDLLFEYYNQLYFIDNRFFPPSRPLGIFLTWYDSLTGIPSIQKTCAFEKASALFNIGECRS